jgi:type III restriction enzyme
MSNIGGTGAYLYLGSIVISPNRAPEAKIEFEMGQKNGLARKTQTFRVGDSLYVASKNLEEYRNGYVITEIDPINNRVVLENGKELHPGETVGDMNEANLRRVQIRETIASHLEKEAELFEKGIKTLSLFFIDEVSKYRLYSEEGEELKGEYAKVFEEEYRDLLNEKLELFPSAYQQYLKGLDAENTHRGYFSIDKKGRCVNSEIKRGSDISDDISAYDLILKNKERLLSFDEPTRFIFSHSALREGWDNPNVFQICTLKHSDNTTARRQEVGRGLRLAVNQEGTRMDAESCGEREVHELNKLTVIAGESYASFVSALQAETREVLSERPRSFTVEYLGGKTIRTEEGKTHTINKEEAQELFHWAKFNKFIDNTGKVSEECRDAYEAGKIPEAKYPFSDLTSGLVEAGVTEENIHNLLRSVYDDSMLDSMTTDATAPQIESNELNENFKKKEFQELWKRLNHKYAYTVHFDSTDLINNAVTSIEQNLVVLQTTYTVNQGEQCDELTERMVQYGESFEENKSKGAKVLKQGQVSQVGYDLVGKIAKETVLTRKTVATILKKLQRKTIGLFAKNPEQFIARVSQLILEQKATTIVEHVSYNLIEGRFETSIFTEENKTREISRAFRAKKAVQPYVFTDGLADKSVERRFAEELDRSEEVCVYAKLPRGFKIPTPMGDYSPDWAIAFQEGSVRHIYFVAETKGSLISAELRPIEKAKIKCAERLFQSISTENIKYKAVTNFDELMQAATGNK